MVSDPALFEAEMTKAVLTLYSSWSRSFLCGSHAFFTSI